MIADWSVIAVSFFFFKAAFIKDSEHFQASILSDFTINGHICLQNLQN